jgi:hypothetical protein
MDMKYRFPFLHLAFVLPMLGAAAQDALPVFAVHLGSFNQPAREDFSALSTYGFVYADPDVNGYSNVYLGGYRLEETARNLVAQLAAKGYANAFVSMSNLELGLEVPVIQLATVKAGDPIDWQSFAKAGPLFFLPDEQQVKIMTGVMADLTTARAQLPRIREIGFHDAFVRIINNVLLRPATEFESGRTIRNSLIPLDSDPGSRENLPDSSPDYPPALEPVGNPMEWSAKGTGIQAADDLRQPTLFSALAPAKPTSIRPELKRTAARELQHTLRSAGVYLGEPDGFFDQSTRDALATMMQSHPVLRSLASADYPSPPSPDPVLQDAIDRLGSDPASGRAALSDQSAPLALAYQAYGLFLENGPNPSVNAMMTAAAGPAAAENPDIDRIILHIVSLHAKAGDKAPNLPCWMFSRHPGPTLAALRSLNPQETVAMSRCGGFWDWKEVALLTRIAQAVCAEPTCPQQPTPTQLRSLATLFINPTALSQDAALQVNHWNETLLQNLNSWSGRDPLLGRYATALRTAFLSTEILLQDFFLHEGFSYVQAEQLALQVLHTLTADYLRRLAG